MNADCVHVNNGERIMGTLTSVADQLPEAVNAAAVIERMKEAVECRSDAELAEFLGIRKTTVSSWRQRGSVPYAECVRIAYHTHSSLDWLITGREKVDMYDGLLEAGIDWELMAVVVFAMEKRGLLDDVDDDWKRAEVKARSLITTYARYKQMMEEDAREHGISREGFIQSLKRAVDLVCFDPSTSPKQS
jgi:hypothetical protein